MTKFINKTFTNHHGLQYTVTAYNPSTGRYTVLFLHNNVTKDVSEYSLRRNVVSEVAAHTKHHTPLARRESRLFHGIKHRLATRATYKDVKLDPRWETLEGFRETLHLVEGYELWKEFTGYSLDKDIKGMNAYGPDSCVFITQSMNASQPRKKSSRKSYKVGTKLNIHGQVAYVVGKLPARSIIRFEETGEVREVWSYSLTANSISKSTKGK